MINLKKLHKWQKSLIYIKLQCLNKTTTTTTIIGYFKELQHGCEPNLISKL